MSEIITSGAILVHIASLLYVIAFIIRDQLLLRILVLVATVLYIVYYYLVPNLPLWDAIIWSIILGIANIWVMVGLILERTTFNLTEREKALFMVFENLSPGEFRKLLKISQWQSATHHTTIITENEPVDHLYLMLEGQAEITKQERCFALSAPVFFGEVAFFKEIKASATVKILQGAQYVRWKHEPLRSLQTKNPSIRIAFYERLNSDMANKVAAS